MNDERYEKGRVPLTFLPGTYDTRVFVGGNYEFMPQLRDIKNAIFALGSEFVPILPYDDFQIPPGQIHDWDLRLLHNSKHAIFDVTDPAGELMEIARAREYKAITLLVYGSRGLAEAPPRVRTMLLESGEHEHRCYGDTAELQAIVKEFLLEKDLKGFRQAVELIGYCYNNYVVTHHLREDGTANHEYKYVGLKVMVPNFTLPQVVHAFVFTSGSIVHFDGPHGYPEWCEDRSTSTQLAKSGIVKFDPPLQYGNKPVDYKFTVSSKGGYALWESDLGLAGQTVEEHEFLSGGREFNYRKISYPYENFEMYVKFAEGYPVEPEPVARFGGEKRKDGMRIPPDVFEFKNGTASVKVKRPRMWYYYGITWPIPKRSVGNNAAQEE